MAFGARHRDKNGEISRKHGNTRVGTLRETYGPGFAKGCADDVKLNDILHKVEEPSLSHLIRDHEAGKLDAICEGDHRDRKPGLGGRQGYNELHLREREPASREQAPASPELTADEVRELGNRTVEAAEERAKALSNSQGTRPF